MKWLLSRHAGVYGKTLANQITVQDQAPNMSHNSCEPHPRGGGKDMQQCFQ